MHFRVFFSCLHPKVHIGHPLALPLTPANISQNQSKLHCNMENKRINHIAKPFEPVRQQTHFSYLEPLSKSLCIHGTASIPRVCTRQCCVLTVVFLAISSHQTTGFFSPHLINAELMTPHRPENQAKNVKHLKPLQLVCSNCLWGTRTCYKHRVKSKQWKRLCALWNAP